MDEWPWLPGMQRGEGENITAPSIPWGILQHRCRMIRTQFPASKGMHMPFLSEWDLSPVHMYVCPDASTLLQEWY